ncbi:type II secretion system F family protein [Bacillus timonensis]|uniref:Type II secretion system F family protein n=1 Tax=Bacillus timonensis TaxID=1033734 RepID=A0A4S3PM49_9BACI|nr:type II secretion system F family protein [Bacillus timonensis]THE10601.1 type II secretion system F family protein [Bacillus timonensis]
MYLVYFLVSTLLFWGTGFYFYRKKNVVKRRIETFIPNDIRNTVVVEETETSKKERVNLKEIFLKLSTVIHPRKNKQERLQLELEAAGIPLKPEEFILLRVVIVGFVLFLSLLSQMHLFVILIAIIIGWTIPRFYLKFKKEKRLLKCASQLPQTLETMSTAMKSGFSFMQAMQIIAKEVPDPIGPEFTRAIQEINLGISMETAFEAMLKRLPNKDLDIVVTALLIQRTTGGNLTQILETIKDTITERVRMKEELNALTAQGKMSAWVISLLPVILGLILNVMNPEYFSPLLSHPLGWTLLGFGAVSGIIGWLLIQKIIKIEV